VLRRLARIDLNEFWKFLELRKGKIKGVVLTGGELTTYPSDQIISLIRQIQSYGYKVKIDTNGLLPDVISDIFLNTRFNYLAIDVKTSSELYKEKLHCAFSDVDVRIGTTINLTTEYDIDSEVRITAVPGLLDESICHKIGSIICGMKLAFIQRFKNTKTLDPSYSKVEPFTDEELDKFRRILLDYVCECRIR
jgi:pyruvate formate lyase activating enzyme